MITEMKAGHLKDIDKPSEPFEVIGKIIPRYENENWTFTELLYEAPYLKSYQNDWACVVAGTLYMPLTLPLMWLYYNTFYTVTGSEKAATSLFLGGANPVVAVGISVAAVALSFVGSVVGMLIARELKKAGVLKK